ncbi:MAG: DNA-formamidopyrimidine glycosylase family protein [Pseudomonadota bacterium]|nr:DNA-formamidopyrimidine glycosylase family protein [Pseudomonadota bacterium]
MPELPEIETLIRQLGNVLAGERVRAVRIFDEKLDPLPDAIDRGVRAVRRAGKGVEIDLGGPAIHIHLRMSGRLHWRSPGDIIPPHARFGIVFEAGEVLCIDPRRFATLTWHWAPAALRKQTANLLAGLDIPDIRARARGRRLPVKAFLLDQQAMPGMGNIYACEILFAAAVSPWRRAGEVTTIEWERIAAAAARILREAVYCRGTSISDWRDLFGRPGEYQRRLRVYGREGKTCYRCPARIERRKLGGRGTYYCPGCQG